MSIDISQFHQVFFEESFEGLEIMEAGLLALNDGEPDEETINTIFRAAHSIKGGAGTFGFTDISDFTHDLETLLDQMRNGEKEVSKNAIDVFLATVDVLHHMLTAAQAGEEIDVIKVSAVSSQLKLLLDGKEATVSSPESGDTPTESNTEQGWLIHFNPHIELMQTGNDPLMIIEELAELGKVEVECESHLPAFTDLVPEECYLSWTIKLSAKVNKATLIDIFDWVEDICDYSIEPLSTALDVSQQQDSEDETIVDAQVAPQKIEPTESVQKNVLPNESVVDITPIKQDTTASKQEKTTETNAGSIRVGTDKVDSLINLVGELVITQSMLTQVGENFSENNLPKLLDGLEQLEQNTRELQEGILQIRMLPISFAFNRFPRLVHDLSSKMGKKVELKLTGEQTEVDKSVMEKIVDPLVHLVRNSLDHGLETPEQRLAAGKPETGTIHLNAYHQAGNIIVEVSDDGAGIDADKVLAKAIERDLISSEEAPHPEKINELIFLPGFSTAETVSDVSGRGVGMDVVRKNVQSLGGNIEVRSIKGQGSTFTIRLPLTLAIMDGQIIQVADQRYILPLISIIESVEITSERIKTVTGKGEVYKLRDEYIPLIRVAEVFELSTEDNASQQQLIVIVENDGHKVGLLVDDLLAQQQIVIKSLEANYRNVTGLAGATILGDGMVALILDIAGLITLFRQDKYEAKGNSAVA